MKFGIFYEHQLPRPWGEGAELKLFQDALTQVELADRLGFDCVWEVEHHFLDEYSHSSAPEVFLAAASQRTRNIRLGHGIRLMPPGYNHPARVAEGIATLDLVSGGRVEFGTGESSSLAELGGFGVEVSAKREQWREALEQCCHMLALDPYPGHEGEAFSMPARNVLPKPVQRPHPPLWVACSNRETIKLAARLGIGALTFSFVEPAEARQWVDDYYRILREECVPIGHAINPNIAMVSGFGVHADAEEALRRFLPGFLFFGYALGHHYIFGEHVPGRTDIWSAFKQVEADLANQPGSRRAIGTPEQVRRHLREMQDAGVDQVILLQQAGNNRHEHICEALELFAAEVMGEFQAGEAEREARKLEALAPHLDAAMSRRQPIPQLADEDIPTMVALGRQVAEQGGAGQGDASAGDTAAANENADEKNTAAEDSVWKQAEGARPGG
ncbi:MAG: LLM class flavin-dependent oxidoreductase [Gammaproteobacteria bacterium AqS3]|nr:LLM class flavin-dependent oxidoreductase [Gammaproteobacteria bacterium AqS3]